MSKGWRCLITYLSKVLLDVGFERVILPNLESLLIGSLSHDLQGWDAPSRLWLALGFRIHQQYDQIFSSCCLFFVSPLSCLVFLVLRMDVYRGVSKNRGKTTKMDGENDDLGVPLFLETPIGLYILVDYEPQNVFFFYLANTRCSSEQDLYVLRRLADVVQPLIRRFTADETVGKPNRKMGYPNFGIDNNYKCFLFSPWKLRKIRVLTKFFVG